MPKYSKFEDFEDDEDDVEEHSYVLRVESEEYYNEFESFYIGEGFATHFTKDHGFVCDGKPCNAIICHNYGDKDCVGDVLSFGDNNKYDFPLKSISNWGKRLDLESMAYAIEDIYGLSTTPIVEIYYIRHDSDNGYTITSGMEDDEYDDFRFSDEDIEPELVIVHIDPTKNFTEDFKDIQSFIDSVVSHIEYEEKERYCIVLCDEDGECIDSIGNIVLESYRDDEVRNLAKDYFDCDQNEIDLDNIEVEYMF